MSPRPARSGSLYQCGSPTCHLEIATELSVAEERGAGSALVRPLHEEAEQVPKNHWAAYCVIRCRPAAFDRMTSYRTLGLHVLDRETRPPASSQCRPFEGSFDAFPCPKGVRTAKSKKSPRLRTCSFTL